jgi:hypothetical protein
MIQINYPTAQNIQSVNKIENKQLSNRISVPAYWDFVLSGDNRYRVFCTPLHFPHTREFYNKLAEIQALRGVINVGANTAGNLNYINHIDPNNMFSYTENISQAVQGTHVRWYMAPGSGSHSMHAFWDNWNPLGIICVGVHAWRAWGDATNVASWAGVVSNGGGMAGTGNTNFINSNWDAMNITRYRFATGQYRYWDNNSNNPGYVAFYLRQLQIVRLNGEIQKYYSFT